MYKALIAEDEPLHRQALARMVDRAAKDVYVAAMADDGREAMDLLAVARFDLVLTDIRMPRVDGLALMAWIAEHQHKRTRVIAISGHADFTYAQQGMRYGVVDYLLKPIKQDELDRALSAALLALEEPEALGPERLLSPDLAVGFQQLVEAVNLLDAGSAAERLDDLWGRLATDLPADRDRQIQLHLAGELLLALAARFPELKSGPEAVRQRLAAAAADAVPLREALAREIRALTAALAEQRRNSGRKVIQKVKAFIDANYEREIGLTDVAEAVFLNPSYLSVLFKEVTGQNFSAYLTRTRIERAKRLLEDPAARIYEVAARVGYADHAYFSRVFKQWVGVGPAEYRRRLGI